MGEDKKGLSKVSLYEAAKAMNISPSKKEILRMPYNILVKHNALIVHKGSSLSSAQRKMVQERISYCLKKGLIKIEDVAREVNLLSAAIRAELNRKIKEDDSSIK